MLKIVISPENSEDELHYLSDLFDAGLDFFHIRKPGMNNEALEAYLNKIPEAFLERCIIHGNMLTAENRRLGGFHLSEKDRSVSYKHDKTGARLKHLSQKGFSVSASLHRIADLHEKDWLYDYVFFSPVFESISKANYKPSVEWEILKKAINQSHFNIVALGGVCSKNVDMVVKAGFSGFALKGAVWQADDPVQAFIEIVKMSKLASDDEKEDCKAALSDSGRYCR